jgi:hypothetical protein
MSFKHNIIKERLDISITSPDRVTKAEFQLDSNANHLYGVALTSDNETLLFYRGSQKIQVNDRELFPEDFESKLLMSSLSVPPNSRMIRTGLIERGNGRVEVWYKDTNHATASFAPYRVTLYLFSKV